MKQTNKKQRGENKQHICAFSLCLFLAMAAYLLFSGQTAAGVYAAADTTYLMPPGGGTLHIEKHNLTDGTPQKADGKEQTGVAGAAVSGVHYDIYRVEGVVNDGRIDVVNYLASPVTDLSGSGKEVTRFTDSLGKSFSVTHVAEGTTDEQGKLAVALSESGVYLAVDASGAFLAPVPMTDPENEASWMADVYVYPKNGELTPVKTQDRSSVNVGDSHTFYLHSPIPADGISADGKVLLEKLVVTDVLDPAFTVDAGSLEKSLLVEYTAKALAEALDADVSYTGLHAGVDYTLTTEAQTVSVALTQTGIARLYSRKGEKQEGDTAKTLRITLPVTANAALLDSAHSSLSAENSFTVTYKNQTGTEIKLTSNKTHTHTGRIQIKKVDLKGNPLAGAVFVLSAEENALDEGNCIRKAKDGSVLYPGDAGYADADLYKVTTDADGQGVFEGIACCDGKRTPSDYYLVEREAPKGYKKLESAVKVSFADHDMTGGGDQGMAVARECSIRNKPVTSSTTNITQIVKTGDLTKLWPYILLLAAAIITFLLLGLTHRKKRKLPTGEDRTGGGRSAKLRDVEDRTRG